MDTLPINRTNTFMKNIEEAIKEHGIIACPNPKCFDKLVSKKKWDSSFGKTIEYGCLNPDCFYHEKKQIHLNSEKIVIKNNLPSSQKNQILLAPKKSYNKILAFSGFALFILLAYTSYYLYDLNSYMENEIENIEKWKTNYEKNKASILTAEKKLNQKPSTLKNTSFSNSEMDSENEQVIINEDNILIQLDDFLEKTKTWITSGNFEQGKRNFQKLLTIDNYKNALFETEANAVREELLFMIGDAYEKEGSQFSYFLLKKKKDFEILKTFVETYDVDGYYKNLFLGKAYLNLPNFLEEKITLSERKKMQLVSLKYYLTAAKNNQLGTNKKSAIIAINDISKAYRLFKSNPKKPSGFKTIETLIQKNDVAEMQKRINYLDKIIDRIGSK